ncbi:uncharacterized [Tachysurus ichikawai]
MPLRKATRARLSSDWASACGRNHGNRPQSTWRSDAGVVMAAVDDNREEHETSNTTTTGKTLPELQPQLRFHILPYTNMLAVKEVMIVITRRLVESSRLVVLGLVLAGVSEVISTEGALVNTDTQCFGNRTWT